MINLQKTMMSLTKQIVYEETFLKTIDNFPLSLKTYQIISYFVFLFNYWKNSGGETIKGSRKYITLQIYFLH